MATFDAEMAGRLKAFQQAYGLSVTGMADPATWQKIVQSPAQETGTADTMQPLDSGGVTAPPDTKADALQEDLSQDEIPSDDKILADLIPALAADANQTIKATKAELFADITAQLWSAVKAGLNEELKGQKLTGTKEEIQQALYAAAWEALWTAVEGFCEAGAEADKAGLTGYAALLSRE